MTRVIVNGVFDILHTGHLKLLRKAKEIGIVCVAIDTDTRVQQLKGFNRPINTLWNRVEMLEALRFVDYVIPFSTDEELIHIIKDWKPHVMVKGSDYKNKPILGSSLIPRIYYVDITNDSTTKIIQSISNR